MSENKIITLNRFDGYSVGDVAREAFLFLGKRYGWDISHADSYGRRRLLYAEGVTPEGYSPWFIAHSNFIDSQDTNGLWKNTFEGDLIKEEWFPESLRGGRRRRMIIDDTNRIVFAKKQSNNYYFMGVYCLDTIKKNSDGNYVRIYRRISDVYPEANND